MQCIRIRILFIDCIRIFFLGKVIKIISIYEHVLYDIDLYPECMAIITKTESRRGHNNTQQLFFLHGIHIVDVIMCIVWDKVNRSIQSVLQYVFKLFLLIVTDYLLPFKCSIINVDAGVSLMEIQLKRNKTEHNTAKLTHSQWIK